jgi:hypothetical protein
VLTRHRAPAYHYASFLYYSAVASGEGLDRGHAAIGVISRVIGGAPAGKACIFGRRTVV